MTILDHTFSGGLLGFALHPFLKKYLSKPKVVLLAMLATFLPDVDYMTRLFGKGYYYNTVNNLYVSHRGFFHSIGGVVFFAVTAVLSYFLFFWTREKREGDAPTQGKILALAGLFIAGGALHLVEDMLGPSGPWGGLSLFFPFSETRFRGLDLYGWYDFFLIYLFLGVFLMVAAAYGMARFRRFSTEKLDRIILAVIVATLLVAVFHLWRSPGYQEELGFKKAEKVWKEYQLSILPEALRDFSGQAQTAWMKTLFATLPGVKTKHYVIAVAVTFGGLFLFLLVRMILYLVYWERLKNHYRVSPVRTFVVIVSIFLVFPPAAIGLYFYLNMPMAVNGDVVPVASGFDYPVGEKSGFETGWNGKNGQGWYVGQSFLDPFYHPGEDWNGKGMGNTDFGQPVYAVAEGQVLFAENCFHWGNMVLIVHRLPEGKKVFSLYAHLRDVSVQKGCLVQRRQQVGTLGRGYKDSIYTAHLHFEIRQEDMAGFPVTFWPRTLTFLPFSDVTDDNLPAWIKAHYLEPSSFIKGHRILGKKERKKKKTGESTG